MSWSTRLSVCCIASVATLWTEPYREGPTAAAADANYVEITIQLTDERSYSPRDLGRQCNERLGTSYDLATLADRSELTPAAKAALLILGKTELVGVRFESNCIVLSWPMTEDDSYRHRRRAWLRRWLKVEAESWPADMGLHAPDALDDMARTVVLVHGLESGLKELGTLATAFRDSGVQVLMFDYPNDGPLAWSGERLSQDLHKLAQRHPRLRLAIVAHSMGGLIARYSLETAGLDPGCVTDLVMLATPQQGSELAQWQPLMELFYRLSAARTNEDQSSRLGMWQDGLGEAADDLTPGSVFLKRLNGQMRPGNVRYHAAAGVRSFLSDAQREALKEELRTRLKQDPPTAGSTDQIVELLDADELRDGLGDGVVALASTRLDDDLVVKKFVLKHQELIAPPGPQTTRTQLFRWLLETLDWKRVEHGHGDR